MNFALNSSLDSSFHLDPCESHASEFYEQKQEKEECCIDLRNSEQKIYQNPPIAISEENTTSIDLPPVSWHGYHMCPKVLSVTNTGRTILINGHWTNSRPYIEGGPLNGNYIFSQIHFHTPSEHEINGIRYPLEMHVVHYKTSYLTQERAMEEKDGTVVLVYLFKLIKSGETVMSQITSLAPELDKVNSWVETNDIALDQLIQPFTSNYYVYWGSVTTKRKSYLLQWIISCTHLCVTQKEVDGLSDIITCAGLSRDRPTTRMKPDNNIVFHVGEEDYSLPPLRSCSMDDICYVCKCREASMASCTCRGRKKRRKSGEKDVRGKCSLENWEEEERKNKSRKKKNKKSNNECIDNETPLFSCESGNESLWSSASCESRKKKKKSKKKQDDCCEIECCESDEKSDKSKKSSKASRKSSTSETESKKKKTKKEKSTESVSESSSKKTKTKKTKESKTQSTEEETSGGEKKKKKKKKNKKEVEGFESINECGPRQALCNDQLICKDRPSSDEHPSCPGFEMCSMQYNSSGLISFSSKSSLVECETKPVVENECASECPEISLVSDYKSAERSENGCHEEVPKETKDVMVDATKIETPPQHSKTDLCSSNVTKTNEKDSEECEPQIASKCKSKSSGIDCTVKKKVSIKNEEEVCDVKKSKSKTAVPKRSQSRVRSKNKGTESSTVQSVQEVPNGTTKERNGIMRQRRASKSPADKTKSGNTLAAKKTSKSIRESKGNKKAGCNPSNTGCNNKQADKNEITTLFEKKTDRKKGKSVAGDSKDVQINFLLSPSHNCISNPSCGLITSESDFTEDKKEEICENAEKKGDSYVQDFTVSAVTTPELALPTGESKKESDVYLLMKHLFHTENKEEQLYRCTSQEYHVAIMYDQNIMQEYKGKFHPQELNLGNFTMLELIPSHPEPENLNFQLKDCCVKRESSNLICIKMKFLMKENNINQIIAASKNEPEQKDKSPPSLVHKETQYSYNNIDLGKKSESPKESQNNEKTIDCRKTETKEFKFKSGEQKKHLKNSFSQGGKEIMDSQKCTLRLRKNPTIDSRENTERLDTVKTSTDLKGAKNKSEKSNADNSDKKVKPLHVKQRKTVYFMYDKVEKDEISGKKIFVGSFRTQEEVDHLKKQKKLLQESGSALGSEKNEKPKESPESKFLLSLGSKEVDLEIVNLQETPNLKESSSPGKKITPSPDKDVSDSKKKDLVALHKYRPKYSGTNAFKKDSKNVLIGKVLSNIQKDSETFKDLAEIIGVEREKDPKISIYELQEAPDDELPKEVLSLNNSLTDDKNAKKKTVTGLAVAEAENAKAGVIVTKKTSKAEEVSVVNKPVKPFENEESQAALILIPVEVESLSKIEVILVEHLNDLKKTKKENEN